MAGGAAGPQAGSASCGGSGDVGAEGCLLLLCAWSGDGPSLNGSGRGNLQMRLLAAGAVEAGGCLRVASRCPELGGGGRWFFVFGFGSQPLHRIAQLSDAGR